MSFDAANPPDWDRLAQIAAHVEQLKAVGAWDRAAFARVWAQAEAAVHGHPEFLEGLINEG